MYSLKYPYPSPKIPDPCGQKTQPPALRKTFFALWAKLPGFEYIGNNSINPDRPLPSLSPCSRLL